MLSGGTGGFLMNKKPFTTITMMDLRREPGTILDRMNYRGERFLLTRHGKPVACLVPPAEFGMPAPVGDPWTEEDLAAFVRARREPRPRLSVSEIEAMLEQEEDVTIEILPNGEIRALGGSDAADRDFKKPLTMREDLGGEYGIAA